jgi:hypothetical protein
LEKNTGKKVVEDEDECPEFDKEKMKLLRDLTEEKRDERPVFIRIGK